MDWRTVGLFLVSLLLIGLLFQSLNWQLIEDKLASLPTAELALFLIGLFLIQLGIMLLSALKWRVILKKSRVCMKNVVCATFVGHLVNNITPVGLAGGEPIRAYILYKIDDIDMPTAGSSVIVDLFLEIFPIFFILLVSLGIVLSAGLPWQVTAPLTGLMIILAIMFSIVLTLVYNKKHSKKVLRLLEKLVSILPFFKRYSKRFKEEFDDIADRFDEAMKLQLLDREIILQGITVSMGIWVLRITRLFYAFAALGIIVTIPTVFVVETMVSAVAFLPLLPGALGIWEWTSVELFHILSAHLGSLVTREYAAMGTVLNRVYHYLIPSIIGLLTVLYMEMELRELTKKSPEELEEE